MLNTVFLAGVVILALMSAGAAHALEVTDDRGMTVAFTQPPRRIVSLLPSLSETVCALGQCDRLVGVDRYSNYPLRLQKLPQVGGGLDPNIEAIVALRPDVVLMATSSRIGEQLQSLGLKVVALEPKSHADVKRVIYAMGQLLGVTDAERVWRQIDMAMIEAAQSVPINRKNARVYFEVNPAPYAAGPSSFIGETLTRLGVRNIISSDLGQFPKLNPEYVVRANPEVIMVGNRTQAAIQTRPGWAGIQAIKDHSVCVFSAAQADVVVRAGPRMAEGAHIMAQCLQGRAGP